MKPTRRSFIKTIAVGILGNGLVMNFPLRALARTNKDDDGIEIQKGYKVFNLETQKNMEALAESLVPGSKEIGIRHIFMDQISKNRGFASFFDAGLWNLNSISIAEFRKPFYQLEKKEDKRDVIDHIQSHNILFFNKFRQTIISLYYSNPTVWKKLSYNGPPQPRGFMDYYLPPQKFGKE
jgi:gluconate 2-dehydrogenase subunit 3-like protein